MTKREVIERQQLWLSWLDLSWEEVRLSLLGEMDRVAMTQEDLMYALRREGYIVSHGTIHSWLAGKVQRVPLQGLQALVAVFARVGIGEWSKGATTSLDDRGSGPTPNAGQSKSHLAYAS